MHYMLTRREKIELKAKLFRGLSDASRLVILESLRKGPQHVNEIVQNAVVQTISGAPDDEHVGIVF